MLAAWLGSRMSPRTAAVIWWVLMATYAVSNAVGVVMFVLDPTKARVAQLVVWAPGHLSIL